MGGPINVPQKSCDCRRSWRVLSLCFPRCSYKNGLKQEGEFCVFKSLHLDAKVAKVAAVFKRSRRLRENVSSLVNGNGFGVAEGVFLFTITVRVANFKSLRGRPVWQRRGRPPLPIAMIGWPDFATL